LIIIQISNMPLEEVEDLLRRELSITLKITVTRKAEKVLNCQHGTRSSHAVIPVTQMQSQAANVVVSCILDSCTPKIQEKSSPLLMKWTNGRH
jgi:hypothetical protein